MLLFKVSDQKEPAEVVLEDNDVVVDDRQTAGVDSRPFCAANGNKRDGAMTATKKIANQTPRTPLIRLDSPRQPTPHKGSATPKQNQPESLRITNFFTPIKLQ